MGIEVIVQNHFSVDEYGFYYTILNLSFLFSFLLDFGIAKYQSVIVAQEKTISKNILYGLINFKTWLALGYIALSIGIGLYLNLEAAQLKYFAVLCLGQVLLSYIVFFRSIFSGLGKFFWEGLFSILDRFLMILLCLFWLFSKWILPEIHHFIWIQLIGYAVSFCVAAIVISRLVKKKETIKNDKPFQLHYAFGFIAPFALLGALEIVNDRIGVLLLKELLPDGVEQVGWYAYGQRWLDAFKMFASLIAIILVTYYSNFLSSKQNLFGLIKFCLIIFFLPVFITVVVSIMNTPFITNLIYKKQSDYLSSIFSLNIATFIPYSLIYILQPLYLVQNKIKTLNIIFTIGLLTNLLLNLYLIPTYQSMGCSLSFLITSLIIVVLQFLFTPLKFPAKTAIFFGLKILVIGASTIGICLLLKHFNFFIQLTLSFCGGLILAVALRIINLRIIMALFQKNQAFNQK
jgi:O-antigen/teichoic acid export membrane protein